MASLHADELERAFVAIVDEDHGTVTVGGEAFVLVHREMLSDLQRGLEEILGRGAESVLLRAGFARGAQLVDRLSATTNGDGARVMDGLRVFAGRTGLCRVEDFRVTNSRVEVRVTNSFMGQAYGQSDRPVCHFLRGFFLAAAERAAAGKNLAATERRCVARGDASCEFEFSAPFDASEPRAIRAG